MEEKICLNCQQPLLGKYCQHCGQKAATHRLSILHFLEHELIHGILHLDKGVFFTLKSVLFRPGEFIHGYLAGRRQGHFNVATLLVILAGIFLYITHFRELTQPVHPDELAPDVREGSRLLYFILNYWKWLMLGLIPIFALSSTIVFRKRRYYYTEHLIANAYIFSGVLFLLIIFNLNLPGIRFLTEHYADILLGVGYWFFAMWQVWRPDYRRGLWMWRMIAVVTLFLVFLVVALILSLEIYLRFFPSS